MVQLEYFFIFIFIGDTFKNNAQHSNKGLRMIKVLLKCNIFFFMDEKFRLLLIRIIISDYYPRNLCYFFEFSRIGT